MEFVKLCPEIADQWDEVVNRSDDGWLYGISAWQMMLTGISEWDFKDYSFAVYNDGSLVAVMPLQLTRSRRLMSLAMGSSGPVVISGIPEKYRDRLLKAICKYVVELGEQIQAKKIEVIIPPLNQTSLKNTRGINPLIYYGFRDVSTHTRVAYLLQPESELWAGLANNALRCIKLARAAGYTVQRGSWKEMVNNYYRVHVETYQRTGVSPHPRGYFEGIVAQIAERGHAVLWVGKDPSGRPVAFHNSARFGQTSLYWTGCCETDHLESGINYLLFWQAIVGAKEDGCAWYELGESFPNASDRKLQGLTEFKGKFGGELRRYFKAEITLAKPTTALSVRTLVRNWLHATKQLLLPVFGPGTVEAGVCIMRSVYRLSKNMAHTSRNAHGTLHDIKAIEASNQEKYAGKTYNVDSISRPTEPESREYFSILLSIKIDMVREYAKDATVLDVCCATGEALFEIAGEVRQGFGMDFSAPFIEKANATKHAVTGLQNVNFVEANARKMPFDDGAFDLVYCFSSLYCMPAIDEVIGEISRILKPNGKCVLEFGNRFSLNTLVCNEHPELAHPCHISLKKMKRVFDNLDMHISLHRAFQILPYWGDRPVWCKPLLKPGWRRLLQRQIRGKMLDEWISNLPLFRSLAFRHIFVCEKSPGAATT